MSGNQIGVMGLGVMGKNLALNIEDKGYGVSLIDKVPEVTQKIVDEAVGKKLLGTYSVQEFVESLEAPRKILMMIKAGKPTDEAIDEVTPFLSEGDILIDGGNAFFQDTADRSQRLEALGVSFIGMGVSGGEEGALTGPAMMPGGKLAAYKVVEPILTAISAKVDGDACCTYIGSDGAGHYVKMVHNGIEYAMMQLIGEAYHLLGHVLNVDAAELHRIFEEWNQGVLGGYLMEITADIFSKVDPQTNKPLLDSILDVTEQNGTGGWTSQSALNLGVPLSTITEAVIARSVSARKDERVVASKQLQGPVHVPFDGDAKQYIEMVRQALYASILCSYTQGFALMKAASEAYDWSLEYASIAKVFRGGCIIRARVLEDIKDAFEHDPQLENLLLSNGFQQATGECQSAWRSVVSGAVEQGIPIPAMSSALAYYDSYRTAQLPANLLQAQRDYFGSHRFQRTDEAGSFHFEWAGDK